jgi:carboxyl-terminal processing protease
VFLDETSEGNLFSALRLRESDLDKHLQGKDEKKDEARTKARDDARKKLEEQIAKDKDKQPKPLPEFGSAEDWPLRQALNQLQGKTVIASKSAVERKAEAKTE